MVSKRKHNSTAIEPPSFPPITIIIPTYNEETVIRKRLENVFELDYDMGQMEVLIVDSASTDKTVQEVEAFISDNPQLPIKLLNEDERRGKASALNLGLKHSNHEIIITGDADSLYSPDIVRKALRYLDDNDIGAITGRESVVGGSTQLAVTTESAYKNKINVVRSAESQAWGNIIFEGSFSVYRKSILGKFSTIDDSGTALEVMAKGYRTILAPNCVFFAFYPNSWREKLKIKRRRAQHVIQVWLKAIDYWFGGRIHPPSWIIMANFIMYLVNPLLFIPLIVSGFFLLIQFPIFGLTIGIITLPTFLLFRSPRILLVSFISSYIFMILGFGRLLLRQESTIWEKSSRISN